MKKTLETQSVTAKQPLERGAMLHNGSLANSELLTRRQVAKLLQVTDRQVWNLERKGLTAVRLGASVRYRAVDVASFIEANRRPPEVETTRQTHRSTPCKTHANATKTHELTASDPTKPRVSTGWHKSRVTPQERGGGR